MDLRSIWIIQNNTETSLPANVWLQRSLWWFGHVSFGSDAPFMTLHCVHHLPSCCQISCKKKTLDQGVPFMGRQPTLSVWPLGPSQPRTIFRKPWLIIGWFRRKGGVGIRINDLHFAQFHMFLGFCKLYTLNSWRRHQKVTFDNNLERLEQRLITVPGTVYQESKTFRPPMGRPTGQSTAAFALGTRERRVISPELVSSLIIEIYSPGLIHLPL